YGDTAQDGTAFGSPESVDGFTYLTELFTLYDVPINIDNFYQHLRNGDMPIGVADYGTYNLMTNAAPELKDSWKIALTPGMEQADGSIDRTVCGCAESSVIFKSTSEREQMAWEFVKWWSSTQVQAQYGQNMQMLYGSDYMWSTANIDAFMELPWDSEDKLIIAEQMTHVVDIARVPGTYLLEREMSNAFNDIVVNGDTAQTRIDEAVKIINREIDRKLEEFLYIDNEGNTIQPYNVPSIESVRKLLGRE
ncbi:MAG: ABC transporter substrate-binding protein, partial [Lachnospiraceae bacterium]|nr:ABC transporter substrate-binding protein [Lachnospiraceae bacterium]